MIKYLVRLQLVICISFLISCSNDHFIKDKSVRLKMQRMLSKQKKLARERSSQLFDVFKESLSTGEKEALQYLYAFMPLNDMADLDGKYFLREIRATLKAKEEFSWGKKVPEDIFLNFVLPLRVNNENLDSFRSLKYEEIKNRIKGLSMKEAALEVNHWCHEKVNYRPSDSRTSSPLSTFLTSWGRCGEESVFAVSALRTVGIPARQVYTPRWAHTDDNHAWVEVWIDGKWYFLGACEPEADLNIAWFTEPARRAMLVHTRAYGCYSGKENVISSNEYFSELNLIKNYAPVKTFFVKVTGNNGKPVDSAKVEFQLYNYSEFYPLAKLYTNKSGKVSFTSGLGDLLLWANKGDSYGFVKTQAGSVDTVFIQIKANHSSDHYFDLDIVPPVQPVPYEVSEKGRIKNQIKLVFEDSIRTIYRNSFKDSSWAAEFAGKLKINRDSTCKVFSLACGNYHEITTFLEKTPMKDRPWALRMLFTLSDKDIRDSKAYFLLDHFYNGFKYNRDLSVKDPGFFAEYILSPQIGNELIRPWRSILQSKFDEKFIKRSQSDISVIIDWVKANIIINENANLLSRCPLSPSGVYNLRVSDVNSRNIFFVALCRSFGIPARLNPINSIPQYYKDKKWIEVYFDKIEVNKPKKGYIHFENLSNGMTPKYYVNFTIGKFSKGIFKTLEFEEDLPIDKFPDSVEVDEGKYMLVTGNRLAGGSVLSNLTFFSVKDKGLKNVLVKVRDINFGQADFGKLSMKGIQLYYSTDNKKIDLEKSLNKKPFIIICLNPGEEPTRHILTDLPAVYSKLDKWDGKMIIVLPDPKTNKLVNLKDFKNLPAKCILAFDYDKKIISSAENLVKRKLGKKLPLVIASDKDDKVIYFSEGYTIGIGEQLIGIIKVLK